MEKFVPRESLYDRKACIFEKSNELNIFLKKELKMTPLIPEKYYHIFNHAIGSENLFKEDRNYAFFLAKYEQYIAPMADTYAYVLMPNHFHFLIRVKDNLSLRFKNKETLKKFRAIKTYEEREGFISRYASKQFSNFFSSYTQAYNKEYNRRGSLFLKNFNRKHIEDDKYFLKLVNYIHFNAVTHKFVEMPKEWEYSSYNSIILNKANLVKRQDVLDWFDGLENFKQCHLYPLEL